jgi:hypothetical protein
MVNKLFGRITNESGGGIPVQGLKVEAWDDDWPDGDDFMGKDITDVNGQYEISYVDGIWDQHVPGLPSWLPDIYISADIRNSAGRWIRLGKSRVYKNQKLSEDLRIDLSVNIESTISRQTNFIPQQHGFHFRNYFKIEPTILDIDLGKWEMGLCGGMCTTVLYHFMNNEKIPDDTEIPDETTSLFKELLARQILTTPPHLLSRMYSWQSSPDTGFWWRKPSIGQRTKREWPQLKGAIDNGQPVVLILVRANGYLDNPTKNHQVLAIGYEYNPATKDLHIQVYDPNLPNETHRLSMNFGLPDGRLYFKDSSGKRTRGFMVNPVGWEVSKLEF